MAEAYQVKVRCKLGIFELLVKDQSGGRGSGYEHDGGFRRVSDGIGPDLCSIFGRDEPAGAHDREQMM